MSMKLSKKDIIMLIVLGVVLFVAVFYAYGIMPLQDKSKELDGTITTKQQQVQDLTNRLAGLSTTEIDRKMDDLYDEYYKSMHDDNKQLLPEEIGKIEFEKKMVPLLKSYNLSGFGTANWNIAKSSIPYSYDAQTVEIEFYIATLSLNVQCKTIDDFRRFIRDMRDDPSFVISGYSYQKAVDSTAKEGEGATTTDTSNECSCAISLECYMGARYVSDIMPEELAPVDNVTAQEGLTLTFDKVENAQSYEVYSIEYVDGVKTFRKLNHAAFSEVNDKMQVIINNAEFDEGVKSAEIFVRAVGDRKEYYKSPMYDALGGVKVTLAQ